MDLVETLRTIIEKGLTAQIEARAQRWLSTPKEYTEEKILELYSTFYDDLRAFKEQVVRKDAPMAEYLEFVEDVVKSFEGVEESGALDKRVVGLEKECDDELRLIAGKYRDFRLVYDIIEFQAAYLVFREHPELGDFSSLDAGKRAEIFKGYMASAGYTFRNVRANVIKIIESEEFSVLREERK